MKMKEAYLVDEGVLLTREDKEFEAYAIVYDKKYGYYDECQCYIVNKEKAIKEAKEYVENGVESTYAIVSITAIPDDANLEEIYVEGEVYVLEDVIYSVAKINGEIVENFLVK